MAPIMMPARAAALTMPFSSGDRANSLTISGRATPVMNTTSPSKNLPAVASSQMRHCMRVMETDGVGVPSGQRGVSSIYPWTLRGSLMVLPLRRYPATRWTAKRYRRMSAAGRAGYPPRQRSVLRSTA